MKYQDTVGASGGMLGWSGMRNSMTGSMDARWGGATTSFDWKHAGPSLVSPRAQSKPSKGRPRSRKTPEENAPTPSGVTPMTYTEPGPYTNQSHGEDARGEFSILPSDQSKAGMGEDSPVWSAGGEPRGYGNDAPRLTSSSSGLSVAPFGSSLPWAPGRGVGAPSKTGVYPAPFLMRGQSFDSTNDASTWPGGGDAAVGGGSDSSIYSANAAPVGGSDSPIWGASPYKEAPGSDRKQKRPAGMSPVALGNIGVVRRSGGWPGDA
jgi:hypothetical protein